MNVEEVDDGNQIFIVNKLLLRVSIFQKNQKYLICKLFGIK
jgi:hypothetical protein